MNRASYPGVRLLRDRPWLAPVLEVQSSMALTTRKETRRLPLRDAGAAEPAAAARA